MINLERAHDPAPGAADLLLVIADDALRGLAVQTLTVTGACKIISCATGSDGLKVLGDHRPEVLVLDDFLGDMSCEAFLDRYHAELLPPLPPWLFLASRGNEVQAARMLNRGAREYLVKGIDLMRLLPRVLDKTLSRLADERQLADANRLLRLTRFAVDHAAEAILTVSPAGKVLEANATACQWLELSRAELCEQTVADLSPASARLDWPALWQTLVREGRVVLESVYRSQSGRVIPVELVAARLRFEGAEYACVSARDITERRASDRRLAEHQAVLEEAVRARTRELERTHERLRQTERLASVGTLAAGFAHEMNNPLGAIRLSAENALEFFDRPDHTATVQKLLGDVVSYTERCARIVSSLMRLAWRSEPKLQRQGVNEIVKMAVEQTARYTLACGAKIELSLDDSVPPVSLAAGEIVQAVASLVENACESRVQGAVVRIRTFADEKRVSISVEDNGPGIGSALKQRIFEPFFTTKKEQGGVGLGLSLAHSLVTASRGEIEVHSEMGKGAQFKVSFPREAV